MRGLTRVVAATIVIALAAGCSDESSDPPLQPDIPVPNLAGLTPHQARDQLEERGLVANFHSLAALAQPCAGLPPAGTIIKQEPPADRQVAEGKDVKLQTSCEDRASAPLCAAGDLKFRALGNNDLNGANDYVGVKILHFRGSPCVLEGTLEAAVETPDEALIQPVKGNPATLRISELLGAGELLVGGWAWREWCGPDLQVHVVMRFEGLEARDGAPTPQCATAGKAPSSLVFLERRNRLQAAVSEGSYRRALARTRQEWTVQANRSRLTKSSDH